MATPAAVQGMLAALDDSDNVIVVRALALLDKEEIRKEPQVRKRLGSFIQEPRLAALLKDPDAHVRRDAARVLGAMGEAAREQAPRLVDLLKDPDAEVRRDAARALGAMGEGGRDQTLGLVDLLKDPDVRVRVEAARALGAMGEGAREQAPRLVDLLKDPDVEVRGAAAGALGAMGAAAREQAPHLGALLKDPDAHVRGEAAKALGAMGEAAWEQAPRLVSLLKDRDERVHQSAAEALGAMGEGARDQAPRLVSLLMEEDAAVRTRAAQALTGMAPIDSSHIAALLAVAGRDRGNRHEWLLRAHIAGGGVPQVERTLRWVLGRTSSEVPKALTLDEARETLRAFAELWPHTEKHTVLRDDLAQRIAHVANLASGQWTRADIELLASHEDNLKKPYPDHAAHLRTAIDSVERWKWLKWLLTLPLGLMLVVVAYVVFGVLFIFAYPYSLWIQAFFHNETWVIKGFGRVGFLLTWVPFLRRRLLAPFKHLLLAEAELDRFPEPYFQDSEVVLQSSGKREPLLTALQSLCGQVVLEGASGLGKSVFLKYLLRRSKSLAVFLRAESCTDGVLEAIQNKLEGYAKDPGFLKSIIYSGALDIYIDGLNEVTTKTRDSIVQFVQRYHKANILLATQRMEWRPPTTSRVYVLQPLSEVLISRFLGSSESLLGERARLRGKEYHEACTHFVQQALSSEHPEELRAATREILSNPMDLTVVAQMLAEGHSPDLFRLRQQQYGLMATDYMQNDPAGFPLEEFAEEAYTMRLEDRTSLPEDRFDKQLQHMQKAKMVVCRQWKGSDGQARRDWNFRHDKLQEFFIAQTFLGQGNPRIEEHMDDPRFRGVYFLLALVLEPEPARKLRDVLVLNAAKTRDHTVSDEFVTLLEARHKAEQARLSRPTAVAAPGA